MNTSKRLLTIFSVTLSCIICDQGTKFLASKHLPKNETFSYLNDIIRITYTENMGAFLGLGHHLSEQARFWLLVVLVGAFLSGLFIYLVSKTNHNLVSLIALSLMFSGGISNFHDRVFNHGAVIDFLNIGLGSLRTGIFNVADIAIMLAVVMLFFVKNNTTA